MKFLALLLLLPLPAGAEPIIHRVIPKDSIPAVFEPEFVPLRGSELGPGDAVLGFSHGGETHLYSLDLMNHHEIVNDEVGGLPVAATW
jgi:hypothetical protein